MFIEFVFAWKQQKTSLAASREEIAVILLLPSSLKKQTQTKTIGPETNYHTTGFKLPVVVFMNY